MAPKKCLFCGKNCAFYDDNSPAQSVDGTIFVATGNYGSTVFDLITENEDERLFLYICNECITKPAISERIVFCIKEYRADTYSQISQFKEYLS